LTQAVEKWEWTTRRAYNRRRLPEFLSLSESSLEDLGSQWIKVISRQERRVGSKASDPTPTVSCNAHEIDSRKPIVEPLVPCRSQPPITS
jgi:hypothetical protein